MSDLDAMTPADVRAFYQQWYAGQMPPWWWPATWMWPEVRRLAEILRLGAGAPLPPRKPRAEPVQGIRRIGSRRPPSRPMWGWPSRCRSWPRSSRPPGPMTRWR